MGIIKKISISVAFVVVAIICFILGCITTAIVSDYIGKKLTLKVRLVEDISLPADLYKYSRPSSQPNIEGKILKGSIGIQDTLRKGDWIYIKFPVVINAKKFEYVKEN